MTEIPQGKIEAVVAAWKEARFVPPPGMATDESRLRTALEAAAAWDREHVAELVTEEVVEMAARAAEPSLWRMIDEAMHDDDWNGGTALNARHGSIVRARRALEAALREMLK